MKANCALKLKMKTQVSKGSKNFVQKKVQFIEHCKKDFIFR
jgi:hypothetical protein